MNISYYLWKTYIISFLKYFHFPPTCFQSVIVKAHCSSTDAGRCVMTLSSVVLLTEALLLKAVHSTSAQSN